MKSPKSPVFESSLMSHCFADVPAHLDPGRKCPWRQELDILCSLANCEGICWANAVVSFGSAPGPWPFPRCVKLWGKVISVRLRERLAAYETQQVYATGLASIVSVPTNSEGHAQAATSAAQDPSGTNAASPNAGIDGSANLGRRFSESQIKLSTESRIGVVPK